MAASTNRDTPSGILDGTRGRLDEIRRIVGTYSKMASSSSFLGSAPSKAHGSGIDFSDLREYVPGEDARHIDWKASLRSGTTLVKRYMEERERRVAIVCPISRSVLGDTSAGEPKANLLAQLAGSVAYISHGYGDRFSFMYDTPTGLYRSEFRNAMSFLEDNLAGLERSCLDAASISDPVPIDEMARHTMSESGSRLIVFLIADEAHLAEGGVDAARKMAKAGCDVRVLAYDDAYLFDGEAYDVEESDYLPYLTKRERKRMFSIELSDRIQRSEDVSSRLSSLGIPMALSSSADDIPRSLMTVLSQEQARRGGDEPW